MESKEKKIFFGGLNELRAFAAFAVIFNHIELFKKDDSMPSLYGSWYFGYCIEKIGKNGVYLFFVLSGFLITYLLLKEKKKFGTILFKNFFLRRIFRIWPLYYFIIFLSLIIVPLLANTFEIFQFTPFYYSLISNPENYSLKSVLLFLLFLPNVASSFGISLVGATQSWSVGVEEQFYIIWPVLIYLFRKNILWIFLIIIFLFSLPNIFPTPFFSAIVSIFPFEFMAIGGLGGYFYFYYEDSVKKITKSKYVFYAVIFFILLLCLIPIFIEFIQGLVLSILFLALILITINEENSAVFRNRYFSFFGKISYGIYMYHHFIIFLIFPFANKYFFNEQSLFFYNVIIYLLTFSLTILISHLSYKYFESSFIRIKDSKYKSI